MQMKKILVTGATGFIGNYVIESLLKDHHQVIASSLSAGKASRQPWFDKVKYIPFNLSATEGYDNLYERFLEPDALIHLAWEGLPNYKAAFHIEENLPRHLSFLTNLIDHGLKDITITGTCFEYGMVEGLLKEDMITKPANPYAIAKDRLRKELQQVQETHSFILKWVRLFYMYGKGQNPNSLLSQLDKALEEGRDSFNMSGGQQVRDFLPVEKVADYITRIALQADITGIVNCCSGVPITVESLVKEYLKQKNKTISLNLGHYPYPDYEPMSFWGDNNKLKQIIHE